MNLLHTTVSVSQRHQMEPLLLDALFEHGVRRGARPDSTLELSVAQAMDVLAAQPARWQQALSDCTHALNPGTAVLPKRVRDRLPMLLSAGHTFFRREGAVTFRAATQADDAEARFTILWTDLFSRCLLDWLREQELIGDPSVLDEADVLVECAKLWIRDIAGHLGPDGDASSFFLDAESAVQATFERGPMKLRVRGHMAPVLLRLHGQEMDVLDYALCEPARSGLRLAQTMLAAAILERAHLTTCSATTVAFFRAESVEHQMADLPAEVNAAFKHYVGNDGAVLILKKKAAAGRQQTPPRIARPCLILGPSGLGKTELARCVAVALGVPFVPVHCSSIPHAEDLIGEIDRALEDMGAAVTRSEDESGWPVFTYPPMLLLFDDAHGLRRQAEWLQPLFGKSHTLRSKRGDARLPHATLMAAATDPGRIPAGFAQHFRRIELEPLTVDDVARIVHEVFASAKVSLPDDLALGIARMGRCNPLRARLFASELRDRHAASPGAVPLVRATLMRLAKSHWKVDEHGLGARDYQYLQALESGAKGLPALQQLLPTLADDIVTQIEPYLLHCGAIHRNTRGRALTALGEQLLHRRRDD